MEDINPELMFTEQGTLFVGGLSENTTPKILRKYFSQYGEVINSVVKNNQRGRTFGFITFADPLIADTVLQNGPHVLDGRSNDSDGKETNEDVKKTDQEQKNTENRRKSITPVENVVEVPEETPEIEWELIEWELSEDERSLVNILKKKTASYDDDSTDLDDFTEEFIKEITTSCKDLDLLFHVDIEELRVVGITECKHHRLIFYTRDEIRKRAMKSSKEKSLLIRKLLQHIKKQDKELETLQRLAESMENNVNALKIARENAKKLYPRDAGTEN